MNDEIAGKVVDAYRQNPLLTGLLLLNVGLFVGFGWYLVHTNSRTGEFIQQIRADKNALVKEMLDLAKSCAPK